MLDALVRTFGPFLLPATVFAVGVVGYVLLYALTRSGDGAR
jgi:hypothetical protein